MVGHWAWMSLALPHDSLSMRTPLHGIEWGTAPVLLISGHAPVIVCSVLRFRRRYRLLDVAMECQ